VADTHCSIIDRALTLSNREAKRQKSIEYARKMKPKYIKAYRPWSFLFFSDPLTDPLTPVLSAMRIHPNVVTVISLLAGVANGVPFAMGHWLWGALVFQFSCFCDGLDGEVARYRGMSSELGAKLDSFADSTRKPSSFIGIGIYFYLHGQVSFTILTVVALIVHIAVHKLYLIAGVLEYDLEFPNFHRKIVRRLAPRLLAMYTFFDEQFIEFVVFPLIAVIVGLPKGGVWFLYGAAFVTCIGLLKLANSLNYRRKGRYDEIYQDWAGTKGNLDKANSNSY